MSTGHFAGVGYHRRLLRDRHRTEAFRDAIRATVKPGDVVVDIGAGTGILSLFAAEAGARRVYAIESTQVANIAREVIKDNGYDHIVEVIEADARHVELPELANVLISECLGNFVYSDGMLGVLVDCRRLLTDDAKIIPAQIDLWLAPASSGMLMSGLNFWDEPHYGFSFEAARSSAENDLYHFQLPKFVLTDAPQCAAKITLTEPAPAALNGMRWTFPEGGMVDSVVGWFTSELAPGIVLSTAPGSDTHWGQVVFPVPSVECLPGDHMTFQLSVVLGQEDMPNYHWTGTCLEGGEHLALRFERGQDIRLEPWRAVDADT